MISLVLGAVRARTAQALTVLVLTALAAAVAVAGPWYAVSAGTRAAASDVANAPEADRMLSVRQSTSTGGDPRQVLDAFGDTVRRLLPIADLQPTLGMALGQYYQAGEDISMSMSVAYRDDLCDHLRLVGDCPAKPGDVVISQDTAQKLNLDIGSIVNLGATQLSDPIRFTVVGRYSLAGPAGAYWSNNLFRGSDGLDPAFTVLETFSDPTLVSPTLTYDVSVPQQLIRGDGGYELGPVLARADRAFSDADLRLVNPTSPLLSTIASDRSLVRDGVLVALGQVLVLSWFAMGLAGRYTGRDRRGDAALLKLRGSTRAGMLGLAFGQHLVPVFAGVFAGAPLGVLAGWWLGGPIDAPADRTDAALMCAAAAGAVLIGGLLVLAAVEIAVLRLPVAALLRRVPSARRTWRADLLDLVLLAVAVAAVYQARADDTGRGLNLVAPALVALAVALLLARILTRVADRVGGVALRSGRLRLGLTAARISRQPGTDRVFTLVTVAVAILATTGGTWWAGHQARIERSEVELGAARVLTVQASSQTALEHAVRTADPEGRAAMAVVADNDSVPPVYAVDSSRLAAVTDWRPEYGDPGLLARTVAAKTPAPPQVTGDRLTITARNNGTKPVTVTAVLQNEATGRTTSTVLGPVKRGEHTVSAGVEGCSGDGCRLVRWELGRPGLPPFGANLTLTAVEQNNPDRAVVDAAGLADISRWRAGFTGFVPQISAGAGGLTLTMGTPGSTTSLTDTAVYTVDATLPLPVVLAGEAPNGWQFGDPLLYSIGSSPVPVRVIGTASVLPAAGSTGMLTDLDTVRRLAGDSEGGSDYQVWLAADAPAATIGALGRAGLTIVSDDSTAASAARLAEQGTAQGARFALFAAVVAMLLAAATVAVAVASDRNPHLEQLRALRIQGLATRAAHRIGTATGAVLVIASVLAGLLAAVIAQPVAGHGTIAFTDGWTVIPPPGSLSTTVLVAAGTLALIVLVLAARLSLRRLRRDLDGGVQ